MNGRRIAIVGVGGRFPGAASPSALFENVAAGRCAAGEATDWPVPTADVLRHGKAGADHARSGTLCALDPDVATEAALARIADLALPSEWRTRLSRLARLTIEVGAEAWRSVKGERSAARTSVILANIALPTEGASRISEALFYAQGDHAHGGGVNSAPLATLPLDAFPSAVPAGLLARALGLGGGSYTLDAACASSLYALDLACGDLEAHRVDAVLAGGVSLPQSLYTQIGFTQLQALSASGRSAPYDAAADGLVVGEGAGMVVLKRLEDAERDGDVILAVIRGIGLSNDVGGSLLSPEREGQLRAMRAAYTEAGWKPDDVDLIEGHGTGTPRGDAVELESLTNLWSGLPARGCVLGSVKSNIGHLLTAAGIAGLCKVLGALQAKVLPPTAHFQEPSPGLTASPFRVLASAEPWRARDPQTPRRAAVSGFGFGGINAHLLLEEHGPAPSSSAPITHVASPADGRIAIVGMAMHVGRLDSLEAFRRATFRGEQLLDALPPERWHGMGPGDDPRLERLAQLRGGYIESFSLAANRFKLPPADVASVQPQQLLMLKVAADALDDAGNISERERAGVIIGLGLDLESTSFHLRWLAHERVRRWARLLGASLDGDSERLWAAEVADALANPLDATRTLGALGGIVPSRIAREFRLGGPSFAVAGDEASGMRAIEVAVRLLQRGSVDTMLAGAVDLAGDVRAVLAADALSPFSSSGRARPFDSRADGSKIAEGAGAVVLKRLEDAVAAGDRIYAVIGGFGAASAGALEVGGARQDAYVRAGRAAWTEAGVTSGATIGLVEAHGSGSPKDDADEARALATLFGECDPGAASTALGAAAGLLGQAGAAASMASFVRAALCLHHQVLPPLGEVVTPTAAISWDKTPFHLPRNAEHWTRDRVTGPRLAAVASMARDGSCVHAILKGYEPASLASNRGATSRTRGREERSAALFLLRGTDGGARARNALLALAQDAFDLELLAIRWHAESAAYGRAPVARAIVAESVSELRAELDRERPAPRPLGEASPAGAPLGGEVAFVFPGSGNHVLGMGRALALAVPEVYRTLDQEVLHLSGHLMSRWVTPRSTTWEDGWEDRATSELLAHPERTIIAQVAHGVAVSDALRFAGLRPAAYLGYSLGESAALFASRTWQDRDGMFARVLASPLFRTQLCGPRTVLREAWGEGADWKVVIVTRPESHVRAALVGTAALLIVNAMEECVVGGMPRDVDATVKALECEAITLHGIPSVHLPVVSAVRDAYRELHALQSTPPDGVRFYSGAWGRPYTPTRDSAADSTLDNALRGFDFPALVLRAWEDGVRIFVEAGPQGSCTRMIRRILHDRPHLAVSACRGEDGYLSLLAAVARVAEAGGEVDLGRLYGGELPTVTKSRPLLPAITLGGPRRPWPKAPALRVPASPPAPAPRITPALAPMHAIHAPTARQVHAPSVAPTAVTTFTMDSFFAATAATTRAHETFLRVAHDSFALTTRLLLDQGAAPEFTATARVAPRAAPAAPATSPMPAFDRKACLTFAVGKLGDMLGPSFSDVDAFPTRVRLPDEPLMLVDRIISVDGPPGVIGPGRVVTEHDVLENAWYLDGDRAPVCISVEAGQADLFLSGYLGIDRETRGLRVYRLLDAKIRFHRDLPRAGETIRYDIRIDRFLCQGDTWLFFFAFDGTIDGEPFITMFDGCAGFFSPEQLATGRGIVPRAEKTGARSRRQGPPATPYLPLVPEPSGTPTTLLEPQLHALRAGDLAAAFGSAFAGKTLTPAMRLPGGRMKLVDRILLLEPNGGDAGLGRVVGEADVVPDAWYLTCHFIDDQVMPGTLMYECCLHTLRVLLLRLGWICTEDARDVHYSPIIGVASELRCRGQVTRDTAKVRYQVDIVEIGYGPEPYVVATASMFADDKHVVQMDGMSVRIVGITRAEVEREWCAPAAALTPPSSGESGSPAFDREQIVAYAEGNPSECFGEKYKPFDHDRRLARLPRDPFLFVDRVLSVEPPPWVLSPGGWVTCAFDVAPDAWYFAANAQGTMPFAVLLEAALQPCGFLAAYLGSALLSDSDLHFRNLDGSATQHLEVHPDAGTLTTRARLTKTSHAGGMILQEYELEVQAGDARVYDGTTVFGFFPSAALAAQVGVRGALPWPLPAHGRTLTVPRTAPELPVPTRAPSLASGLALPGVALSMIDTVTDLDLQGGAQRLGFLVGKKRVDPSEWFFRAHFHQDPVMPGSLGLEALLQLLKVFARERFPELARSHRFQSMALGARHVWQYRGQVIPENKEVRVEAEITALTDGAEPEITARGQLSVDGKIIYTMKDFSLRLVVCGPEEAPLATNDAGARS